MMQVPSGLARFFAALDLEGFSVVLPAAGHSRTSGVA